MRKVFLVLMLVLAAAGTAFAGETDTYSENGLTYALDASSLRKVGYNDDPDTWFMTADFVVVSDEPMSIGEFEKRSLFSECESLFDVRSTYRNDVLFNNFRVTVLFRGDTWKVSEILAYRKDGKDVTAAADYKYTINDYKDSDIDKFKDIDAELRKIKDMLDTYFES